MQGRELIHEAKGLRNPERVGARAKTQPEAEGLRKIKTMNINIFKRSNPPIIHATIVPWSPLI